MAQRLWPFDARRGSARTSCRRTGPRRDGSRKRRRSPRRRMRRGSASSAWRAPRTPSRSARARVAARDRRYGQASAPENVGCAVRPRRFEALAASNICSDRPFLPLGRLPMNFLRREGVESVVIGRVHRDELALQMRRKLGDREAVALGDSGDLVAIGLGRGGLGEIEQAARPRPESARPCSRARRPICTCRRMN